MHKNFEKTESGIVIHVPLQLYARPAVIKALYQYHNDFLISYELVNEELLLYFEPLKAAMKDWPSFAAEIMKSLDFQMIRYDTMNATKEIRQLLVGRALYATCIEPDHDNEIVHDNDVSSWKKDTDAIFNTWAEENS